MSAKALAIVTIALGAAAATIACVLADPPPIVNPAPAQRPKIVVDSVSPPPGQILRTDPCTNSSTDCFVVPVEADPSVPLTIHVFLDHDPTGPTSQQPTFYTHTDNGGVLAVGPDAGTIGQRTFSFGPNTPLDPTQCHTITAVVGYSFVDDPSKPVTPPGGDTVFWFYQPTSDCSFYDAGTAPDTGAD
jgi:hypothetical protein